MASLADSWSTVDPGITYDRSNAEVAPVAIPSVGSQWDQMVYGSYRDHKQDIDKPLQEIAQAAGLPNFDWRPYLAQVAEQNHQAGVGWNEITGNNAIPVYQVVQAAAASNPQLQTVLPQIGPGSQFWQQGEDRRQGLAEHSKAGGLQNNTQLLSVLAGPVAAGAFAPAGGASAVGGFGEAAYAGGGAAAAGGAGSLAAAPAATSLGAGESVSGAYAATPYELSSAAGTYGGAGGAGGGAGGAAGSTALSRILDGTGGKADYLSVLGNLGMTAYSAYASDKQADAYKEQAAKFEAMGAPYRNELSAISADPNKFYQGPAAQQGLEAVLRKLSVNGNPAGSPYAQSLALGALYDKYGQERALLGNLGGLSAYNSAAPGAANNAIGATSNTYNAIGYGAGQLFNPPQGLEDILKQYKISY